MNELLAKNAEATQEIAEKIGQLVQAGDVLVLTGDLGAGKTTFTKGLAKALGINQMIKSPTYTIVREYRQGRLPLFHMDVYRLTSGADELGLQEYFDEAGVSVIEWGNLITEELPKSYVEVTLKSVADGLAREISFRAKGQTENRLMNKITELFF